ncbi:MAG: hypothetical protein JWO72_1424 [Caulobacteraceae bacterium]|jgi:hypothetical protein|nr:hypothetical protein [Caulobacteraceae bacterium]
MSIIFERARLAGAVLVCAALLVFSNYAWMGWQGFLVEPTPAKAVADVRAGLAILQRARTPMTGIQFCDAVKSFLPNKVSREDGDLRMATPADRDVILCFNGDIDYGEALQAVQARKLFWQRGIGGGKFVAFAPSEARFLQVAAQNGLHFAPGDLKELSPYLDRLAPHDRAHKDGDGWLIDPSQSTDEALFGPYLTLGPGRYDLKLAFEPVGGVSCALLASQLRVETAATADARVNTLAPRQAVALQPVADGAGCRLEGHIGFSAPAGGARALETPIWVTAPSRVKLVGYQIFAQS